MKKTISKLGFSYVAGVLVVFVLGSLLLRKPFFILFLGMVLLMFTGMLVALTKKLELVERQNNLNMERFAISLEHVSNVLFDNVLEADLTNDCLIGENAAKLTELLQIPADSSYSSTIDAISRQMVEKAYAQEYRSTLSVENVMDTFTQGRSTLEYECIERSDGETYRWIRVHYCIYRSNVTNCVKVISYVKNIEEEKRAYRQLVEKASLDQMTGVLNKMATKEIVSTLLKKYADESNIILMIDIDDFKSVNDRYGHDIGDEVIVAICNIIKNNVRDTDIIGRMGGDEFLVCLRESLNTDSYQGKVEQLLRDVQAFRGEYQRQTVSDITVSIGVVNTFANENFDELYHYADTAMYTAKMKGKNQYCVYDYTH